MEWWEIVIAGGCVALLFVLAKRHKHPTSGEDWLGQHYRPETTIRAEPFAEQGADPRQQAASQHLEQSA